MEGYMGLFADGAYIGWVLLALGAVALEFATGTMIFLSLAMASGVVGLLSWTLAPGMGLMFLLGTCLWVFFSLLLKNLFGSWGSTTAVADPNEYLRETSVDPSMKVPADDLEVPTKE